ncbi:MAG: hypothetical protein DRP42_04380 [Tenericutes bacterium]|nr:MAG: hypothetical protein DRP42_04380 [Mycoplasmatota bacterium]
MPIRLNTDYPAMRKHLEFLGPEDLLTFELKAAVLSFTDVCTYLCIHEAEIPEQELEWARSAHARGQVSSIDQAGKSLFSNMNTRNGAVAALEYLRATSGLFQVEATPISAKSGGGFTFNVNLTNDDEVPSPSTKLAEVK